MDAYTLFRNDILKQGEIIGESKGINKSINSLAKYFLNEKDNNLTKEEAFQKAKEILDPENKAN